MPRGCGDSPPEGSGLGTVSGSRAGRSAAARCEPGESMNTRAIIRAASALTGISLSVLGLAAPAQAGQWVGTDPVSYTHLTLPTIYSV